MPKNTRKKPVAKRNLQFPADSDSDLQRIIEDATLDAYGFEAELWGWQTILQDEMEFPCPVHVLDQSFEVEEPEVKYRRVKFTAYLGGNKYLVDATDVSVDDIRSRNNVLLAAYRKWLEYGAGIEGRAGRNSFF